MVLEYGKILPGDWRLPCTVEYLRFLSDGYTSPALVNTVGDGQWEEGDVFFGVQFSNYWSGREYGPDETGTTAWVADVDDKEFGFADKTINRYCVWPVRARFDPAFPE